MWLNVQELVKSLQYATILWSISVLILGKMAYCKVRIVAALGYLSEIDYKMTYIVKEDLCVSGSIIRKSRFIF